MPRLDGDGADDPQISVWVGYLLYSIYARNIEHRVPAYMRKLLST